MTLEIHIEQRACEWLKEQGCDVFKFGYDGLPDRQVVYLPDRHFWIEFKRPGGGLTAAQKQRIPLMRKRGHSVFVIDTLEEVKAVLRTKRGERLTAAWKIDIAKREEAREAAGRAESESARLREALRESASGWHSRHSSAWESCPVPVCARARAALSSSPATPEGDKR